MKLTPELYINLHFYIHSFPVFDCVEISLIFNVPTTTRVKLLGNHNFDHRVLFSLFYYKQNNTMCYFVCRVIFNVTLSKNKKKIRKSRKKLFVCFVSSLLFVTLKNTIKMLFFKYFIET